MAGWDDVRAIALALPQVSEEPLHGEPAWRVRDKLIAWSRPLRAPKRVAVTYVAEHGLDAG